MTPVFILFFSFLRTVPNLSGHSIIFCGVLSVCQFKFVDCQVSFLFYFEILCMPVDLPFPFVFSFLVWLGFCVLEFWFCFSSSNSWFVFSFWSSFGFSSYKRVCVIHWNFKLTLVGLDTVSFIIFCLFVLTCLLLAQNIFKNRFFCHLKWENANVAEWVVITNSLDMNMLGLQETLESTAPDWRLQLILEGSKL